MRGDQIVTPKGNTLIYADDILYVITPKFKKNLIKQIFLGEEKEVSVDG
jgi:NhaP-type Na+/H+ and K+/H+ antiporter